MANKTLIHKATGQKVTVAAEAAGFYESNGWEGVQDGRKSGESATSTRKPSDRGAKAKD
jgi:hypothetical protein